MKTKAPLFLAVTFFCLSGASSNSKATTQGPAASAPETRADLVLTNGRVWLGGDSSSFAEAVAISGNRIVRVGPATEFKQLIREGARVIDLGGKLVAPGFNDAHIHFLSGALGLDEIDMTGAASVAEIIERIATYARKHPDRQWLTGHGWLYTMFPGGLPTKSYLDAVIKDRPVFLRSFDGRCGWANTKALQLAGITRDTKFERYGEIVRDAYGEPAGVLKEGAQTLVSRLIPEPTHEQKLDALRRGMKLAASLGITSIQNAGGAPEEFSLYQELLKRGELTIRVSMAFSVGESFAGAYAEGAVSPGAQAARREIDRLIALKNQSDLNPILRANSVKILFDGAIESRTAAVLDRYSDLPPEHGAPFGELAIPPDIYRDLVATFDKAGFQIITHAAGDRAAREALNVYEEVLGGGSRSTRRHRIEHLELISPEDIRRFSRLGVIASMEPVHADPGSAEVWSKAVGIERLKYAFAFRSLLNSGARLVFGSDWPAAISLDPIRGLHVAINRRTLDGHPHKGWVSEQRINVADALRAYTQGGAYSSFEEAIKGRIAPGMLADIVVLSQDLFKIDPMRIHESRALLTVFDGKVIYQNGVE